MSVTFPRAARRLANLVLFGLLVSCTGELPNSAIPANQAERQLKLGSGGLRDVEFAVQLLQMVHGRTDESLHVASTVDALAALGEGGYVGRDDAYRRLDPRA